MSYPLTLVEFKSWLESKKEDDVTVHGGITFYNQIRFENPTWVNSFICETDSYTNVGDCIKAKEVLQVVNNLYTCTVCNKYNPEGASCERENCPW